MNTTMQNIPTNIRQFLEQRGWRYTSHCGCSNNMSNYLNDAYPEMQISANNLRMEVKRKIEAFSKDYKVLAVAGTVNYSHIYEQHFPKT